MISEIGKETKMNQQEIFDFVAKFLADQGRTKIRCRYRSALGFKCAVGCLIPDHLYDDDMEEMSVYKLSDETNVMHPLAWKAWLIENPWFRENQELLLSLQVLHDLGSWHKNQEKFLEEFGDLARGFNLSTDSLKTCVLRQKEKSWESAW